MIGVCLDVLNRRRVKHLRVNDLADKALIHQIAHRLHDAADGKAHPNPLLLHIGLEHAVDRERRAAAARLKGKTILKIGRLRDDLGAVFGHHQLAHVLRHAHDVADDLFGVADLVNHAHVIHIRHGNAGGRVREGHEAIRNHHDPIRVFGVRHRIGQHAAIALSADRPRVSVFVRRRRADERHVQMDVALLNRADTTAVRANDRRLFEFSLGNGLADLAANAGGLDARNHALLDKRLQRVVRRAHRGGADGDIPDAHPRDLLHDHVDHIISIAEMVVEAEIHAVMQFALFQRFAQRGAQLAPLRVIQRPHRGARLPIGSVVPVMQPPISGFPHPRQNLIRDLASHLIFHRRSLLCPRARQLCFPFSANALITVPSS